MVACGARCIPQGLRSISTNMGATSHVRGCLATKSRWRIPAGWLPARNGQMPTAGISSLAAGAGEGGITPVVTAIIVLNATPMRDDVRPRAAHRRPLNDPLTPG